MWIVSIPLILILFVVVGLGAGLSAVLDINIMPVFAILSLVFAIIGFVNIMRCNEEQRKVNIILTVISIIFFIISCCVSITGGDVLSWIWYHI